MTHPPTTTELPAPHRYGCGDAHADAVRLGVWLPAGWGPPLAGWGPPFISLAVEPDRLSLLDCCTPETRQALLYISLLRRPRRTHRRRLAMVESGERGATSPPPDGLRTPAEAARKLGCSIKQPQKHKAKTPKRVPSPDTITPTTPLRLDIAAQIAFPDGSIGVSGLRREIERGNLRAEIIAGKIFTTLANIEDMRKQCAVPAKVPISCSASQDDSASGGDGSSSIHTEARARQAQAHSQMIAQGLKKRSRRTSQKSTSRNSAAVIRMKS